MRKIINGILAAGLIIVLTGNNVSAATTAAGGTGAASGLSISPLRHELTLKPGQADKIDISLRNITGGEIIAKASVRDFESDNISGNPKIISDPKQQSPASIRNFLVDLPDVPLAVGEQKTISIPIQVRADATPGAYYGLIAYKAVTAGDNTPTNNNVALSASVSSMVLVTVPGNVTERIQVNAIHVYKQKDGKQEGGFFFTTAPQSIGIEMHNIGNSFGKPFGHIAVQQGGKDVISYEMNGSNQTRSLMLPNSTRVFTNNIKKLKPGRYTVVTSISYGSGSAILTAKKTFWVIQSWMIAVAVLVVLLLIAVAFQARRRFRRVTSSSRRR